MVLLEADIELLGLCLIYNRFIHKSISFVAIFMCIFSLICGHVSFPTGFTWDITIRILSETGYLVERADGYWVHLQAKFKAFPLLKFQTLPSDESFVITWVCFICQNLISFIFQFLDSSLARAFVLQVGLSSTPFPLSDLHLCRILLCMRKNPLEQKFFHSFPCKIYSFFGIGLASLYFLEIYSTYSHSIC